MFSGNFTVSYVAIFLAMVFVCHATSAAKSVSVSSPVNDTSSLTSANKPAGSGVVRPVSFSNNAVGNAAHLRVRRKGGVSGSGVGGAIAGGLASGAALSLVGGLLGGRV